MCYKITLGSVYYSFTWWSSSLLWLYSRGYLYSSYNFDIFDQFWSEHFISFKVLYSNHFALCMYCVLWIVLYALYSMNCIVFIAIHEWHSMHSILCLAFYTLLHSKHCILSIELYIVFYVLNYMQLIYCTIYF